MCKFLTCAYFPWQVIIKSKTFKNFISKLLMCDMDWFSKSVIYNNHLAKTGFIEAKHTETYTNFIMTLSLDPLLSITLLK